MQTLFGSGSILSFFTLATIPAAFWLPITDVILYKINLSITQGSLTEMFLLLQRRLDLRIILHANQCRKKLETWTELHRLR